MLFFYNKFCCNILECFINIFEKSRARSSETPILLANFIFLCFSSDSRFLSKIGKSFFNLYLPTPRAACCLDLIKCKKALSFSSIEMDMLFIHTNSMFKQFHRVEQDPKAWHKNVSDILGPIQGKYDTAVFNQEFKESYKNEGLEISGNSIIEFRKGKNLLIQKIRHERDFVDSTRRQVKIFIFKDINDKEYQLYYFTDGRLEIISPDRWDVYKKKV